jgi:hypothetical protein
VAAVEPEWGRLTNPYQRPRPNQKPSGLACGTPYQTLPDPVLAERISLGDLAWSGVRLPGVTNPVIWVGRPSVVPLPIITSRGVKYTHNDHEHRILYRNRGPTRICLVPTEHTQKEIAPPHPDDPESPHGPGPAVLTPRPRRTTATAQILCAKQVNLVMIS